MHVSLYDGAGNNLLAVNQQQPLRHAIAGCLELLPACMPIFAPNHNGFRRLGGTTNIATQASWGYEDRDACLRIPESDANNLRVEYRLAGADANPYLAIAASLLCGYIGMVEGINPSAPVVGRGYERRNLRLPLTIEDALERMENSKTVEKYLGTKFITGYVAVKRAEHENFKRVISSWEREFLLFAV